MELEQNLTSQLALPEAMLDQVLVHPVRGTELEDVADSESVFPHCRRTICEGFSLGQKIGTQSYARTHRSDPGD